MILKLISVLHNFYFLIYKNIRFIYISLLYYNSSSMIKGRKEMLIKYL